MSRACFEDQTGFLPLALLALAAVAGRYGGEVAGRIGALLWPTVAALLVGLMAFAVADAKWDHIVRAANIQKDGPRSAPSCLCQWGWVRPAEA